MANREKGKWTNYMYSRRKNNENQYMSYQYIHTDKGSYVLFNDNPKNEKRDEDDEKRKFAENTNKVNTICYSLKDGTAKRSFLFGEPTGDINFIACYTQGGDYNNSTNTFATVITERHGHKNDYRMTWITF
jgi:hypothetical protein